MMTDTPLTKRIASKIYCELADRIAGQVALNTSAIQLCGLSRAVANTTPDEEGKFTQLASIRTLELRSAKNAVQALRTFGDEVRKVDGRMRGYAPQIETSVRQEVQEHPCLFIGVSERCRRHATLRPSVLTNPSHIVVPFDSGLHSPDRSHTLLADSPASSGRHCRARRCRKGLGFGNGNN